MDYNTFINSIEILRSNTVRTIRFPKSCTMQQIPEEFRYLLPDVLGIVDNNKEKLCRENEVIAIFGMQVSIAAIVSDFPKIANRVISNQNPGCHLCCNLSYLVVNKDKLKETKSWEGEKTIIVDFTAGVVMDGAEYINRLFNKSAAGTVYGYLSPTLLHELWQYVVAKKIRIHKQ